MHLRQTVRFCDGLSMLLEDPQRVLLEVGPRRTLGNFVAQHPARGPEHVVLSSLPDLKNDVQDDQEFILGTAAQLWLEGVRIDWKTFHDGAPRRRIPLPTYPFERQHYQLRGTLGSLKAITADQAIPPLPEPDADHATSNGKPLTVPLSSVHRRPNLPVAYAEPRNDLESAITGVWEDTLGIDAPGINDNFFALGGHSLSALQVIARVRDLFEIEFTVADLYETPTIAGLAETVVRLLVGNSDAETLEKVINDIDGVPQRQKVS